MGDTRDEPTRSAGGLANEPEEGFMRVTPDPTDKTALQFSGSPSELADMIDELETTEEGLVEFGGLQVVSLVNRNAKHDGNPAFGFEIGDAFGSRTVGRVILMDTDRQLEFQPEWVVRYENEVVANENLAILGRRSENPIASITLDMCFEDDEPEIAAAKIAAKHGVSVTIIDPHGPGGGWPVVRVTGLTRNVENALRSDDYGWGMDSDDVLEFLG